MGGGFMEMMRNRRQKPPTTPPAMDLAQMYQPMSRLQGAFSQQPQTFQLPQMLGQQAQAPVNHAQYQPMSFEDFLKQYPQQ